MAEASAATTIYGGTNGQRSIVVAALASAMLPFASVMGVSDLIVHLPRLIAVPALRQFLVFLQH
ncbi:MAG TPA: hypothetical protein VK140_17350, partial [Ktedonobacteraceae bacterium]|nr:hypothetical protein [Ktedonobacteraceae bacterium]